jgi:hypothetical protein
LSRDEGEETTNEGDDQEPMTCGVAHKTVSGDRDAGIVVRTKMRVKEIGGKKILFPFTPMVIRPAFFRLPPA